MVNNAALSVGAAVARVFALLVDAGEPRWALLVDYAVRTFTPHVRVAQEALRTIALRTAVDDTAFSVDAAILEVTRVLTLLVDACLLHWAVRVGTAPGDKTLNVGVPDKAVWARAHRAMPGHVTFSIGGTVIVDGTGVLALLCHAGESITTLLIHPTLRGWGCELNNSALDVWVTVVTARTAAHSIMVDDITERIDATGVWAWVNTFLICTCQVSGAVRIDDALRSALHIWITKVSREASTERSVVLDFTICIDSTGIGVTWINWYIRLQSTGCKRITNESIRAAAQWVVADHTALSLISTYTNAWVNTLPVNACTTQRTVRVDGTFCLASKVWVSKVARKARTHCPVFHNLTFGVWSTWSRDAWIRWSTDWFTANEGIACHAARAGAQGIVVDHLTDGINATGTWTRINTPLVVAS